MRTSSVGLVAGFMLAGPAVAAQAKDKHDRYDAYGYAYERDGKIKFQTADGCKVEQRWKKGEYSEKVKCKPGHYGYRYRD